MSTVRLLEGIGINFYDKNLEAIRLNELEQINYGGQARLYKFRHNGVDYLLKAVFCNDRKIFRAINTIRSKLLKEHDLPATIIRRTLPIGQGCCNASYFDGIGMFKYACLFVFNYLAGKDLNELMPSIRTEFLNDYLKNSSIENFDERKRIAKDIAKILMLLEKNDIVHGDLQDNWMIDESNNVNLIDIEGSGILKGNSWDWAPITEGKAGYLRPGEDKKEGKDWIRKTTLQTDRWIGFTLIFNVLTGIKHPYFFLPISDRTRIIKFINETDPKIKDYKKLIDPALHGFFEQLPLEFRELLFRTFILGYNEPNNRASFQEIYQAIIRI